MRARTLAVIVGTALVSCASEDAAYLPTNITLEEWVQKALPAGDQLACQKSHDGDYFFVTKPAGGVVKVGSRLDATIAGVKQTSFTFISEWIFLDEHGHMLQSSDPPVNIAYESAKPEAPYLVSVESYRLGTDSAQRLAQRMLVKVWVKECLSLECERRERKGPDESEYSLPMCEIQLKDGA